MNSPELNVTKGESNQKLNRTKRVKPTSIKAVILRTWAHIKKEMKVLTHDRLAMLLLFLLPTALTLLIQFGITEGTEIQFQTVNGTSKKINVSGITSKPIIGILDEDYSEGFANYDLSQEFTKVLQLYQQAGKVNIVPNNTRSELDLMLGLGQIYGYVLIANGFEFNISTHFVSFLCVYIDMFNSLALFDVETLVESSIQLFKEKFEFSGAINQNIQEVNVPSRAIHLYRISPFFFPIVVFSMACLITSQALVGDVPKDRIILSPVNKGEIIIGKLIGSVVINTSMVFILLFLTYLFGVEVKGSVLMYFFVLWSLVLNGSAAGLLLSSISKTSLAAFQYYLTLFIYQIILILFINNELILSFFPIYAGGNLILSFIMAGEEIMGITNGLLPIIVILYMETIIFTYLAYFIYKKTRGFLGRV